MTEPLPLDRDPTRLPQGAEAALTASAISGRRAAINMFGPYEKEQGVVARYPGTELVSGVRRLGFTAKSPTFPFSRFPDLEAVGLLNARAGHLAELGRLRKLRYLALVDPQVTELDALATVHSLEHLMLNDADALRSLAGLSELPSLRTLHVIGFDALGELPRFGAAARSLRGLTIRNTTSRRARLDSLAPVEGLTELRYLVLIAAVADKSLRPLHGLTHLEHVELLPAKYPAEELHALRAALPGVAGNLHTTSS